MKKKRPAFVGNPETPLARAVAETSRLLLEYSYSEAEGVRLLKARMLLDALTDHGGNQCKAARALRLHRNTLSRQVEELRLLDRVTEIRASREKMEQAAGRVKMAS